MSSSTRGKRLRSLFIRSSDLSNTEQTQDTRSDSTFQPWWSNVTTISHAHFSGLSERWEGKHLEIYAGTGPWGTMGSRSPLNPRRKTILIAWREINIKRDSVPPADCFSTESPSGGCSDPGDAMLPLPLMDKFNAAYTVIRKSSAANGLVKLRPYFEDLFKEGNDNYINTFYPSRSIRSINCLQVRGSLESIQ